MKFTQYNFHKELQQGIDSQGFKRATDIQFKAIPSILKGEDVMAIAATGTGKTAAYAIPIIEKLIQQKKSYKGPAALILAPTRELVNQIAEVFNKLANFSGLLIVPITGGVDQENQIALLKEQADIVVATPGRIFDLHAQKYLSLRAIQILVLDESDRMMDMGFMKDVIDIKSRLPKKHQTLFFSATINEELKKQAYKLVKNAIRIQVSPKNQVSKNVQHKVIFVAMDDKRFFLEKILKQYADKKIIVFVRTQIRAERVSAAMKRVGNEVNTLHGGLDQAQRFQVLNKVLKLDHFVLITTDLSARGIDIKNVSFVINYDIPDEPENYIHRLGRTGRGVEKGFALSLCSNEEREKFTAIEQYLNKKIDIEAISAADYELIIDTSEEKKYSKHDIMALINKEKPQVKKKKNK
jgi:ATP-dependent RNA helicase RhlE